MSENTTDKLEYIGGEISEELKTLYTIVDQALDPYIDQLYTLAPEVYGKAKTGLLGLLTGLKDKIKDIFIKIDCRKN